MNPLMVCMLWFLGGGVINAILFISYWFIRTRYYKASQEDIIQEIMLLINSAIRIESKKIKKAGKRDSYHDFEKIIHEYIIKETTEQLIPKKKEKPLPSKSGRKKVINY